MCKETRARSFQNGAKTAHYKREISATRKPHTVMTTKGNNNKILEAKTDILHSEHNNQNEGRQHIRNRRTKHKKQHLQITERKAEEKWST